MADALRGSTDAAEYKHGVLGLIFLKYISDAFEEHLAVVPAKRREGRLHRVLVAKVPYVPFNLNSFTRGSRGSALSTSY